MSGYCHVQCLRYLLLKVTSTLTLVFSCFVLFLTYYQRVWKLADTLFSNVNFLNTFSPKTYKESCLQFYHSELEQLSFAKDPEESRKHINTWVSKQTEGQNFKIFHTPHSCPFHPPLPLLPSLFFLLTSLLPHGLIACFFRESKGCRLTSLYVV